MEKINTRQLIVLIVFFVMGTIVVSGPSEITEAAKQDSWISSLLGTGVGFMLVWIYYALSKRYPNMTMVDICEQALGKWPGKFIAILYTIVIFQFSAGMCYHNAVFTTTTILPDTPMPVIVLITLCVIIYMIRIGIEPIARAGEIFFPLVILLLLIFIAGISPQMKIENMQPFFESSFKDLLSGGFRYARSNLLPLVSIWMILPVHVNHQKKGYAGMLIGILLSGIIMLSITVTSISVLGVNLTVLYQFPTYILAKKISIGHFFERVEIILATIWIITIVFKIYLLYYAANRAFSRIFGLPNSRFLVIPISMIFFVVILVEHTSPQFVRNFITFAWQPTIIIFAILLPLSLLIFSWIRGGSDAAAG